MAVSRALPQSVSPVVRQRLCTSLISSNATVPNPSASIDSCQPNATVELTATLRSYYQALFAAHGGQHWWPGRTRFEIIVGAILTQNTSWTNVERAIRNLRSAGVLSPGAIHRIKQAKLATLLRPSGYFRQKAKTAKNFVRYLYRRHNGSLNGLFAQRTPVLREQLLSLRGIGPETADSILLYAGKHPVFVVDAYTRRILNRHGIANPKATYDEIRTLFESSLPAEHQLFNEFHALLVHIGKNYCRPIKPRCAECPLRRFLPQSGLPIT